MTGRHSRKRAPRYEGRRAARPAARSGGGVPFVLLVLLLACDAGERREPGPSLDLPPRPANVPGGGAIAAELRDLDFREREEWIVAEVARGNVPEWLRHLRPVEVTGEVDADERRLTFWVTPDYLSVGSARDYFLVPLSPGTALRIADLVGGALPTPGMVDAMWLAADTRLIPIRIPPDENRWTVRYFERHSALVKAQARQQRAKPGELLAGHKLDIVVVPGPASVDSGGVGLYGWHRSDGTPIQPLFPVPPDDRPHFSIGVRLVHRTVFVDGVARELSDVMADPALGPLLGAGTPPEEAATSTEADARDLTPGED